MATTPLIDIRIEGLQDVQRVIKQLPETMFAGAKREFNRAALNVHARVSDRVRGGSPLHSRTGALRRSIRFKTYGGSLKTLHSDIWAGTIYAPIHETGGTIKAKKAYRGVDGGPYLNIPLPPNKTAAGVTRLQAREVFQRGGYIVLGLSGNHVVMLDDQPYFVLKKQVKIPARLGMQKEAAREVPVLLGRLRNITFE